METQIDGIEQEGQVLDENTELADLIETEETPQESSPETQADDTAKTESENPEESPASEDTPGEQVQEPNKPFHEDPKIQEYIERQVNKRIEEGLPQIEQNLSEKLIPKTTAVPDWFGGDEEAWQKYQEHENQKIQEAEERAIARIRAEQESEAKRVSDANQWLDANVSEIEAEGVKVDRNKLMKTALDYQLVDTQGRWNYKAAWQILNAQQPKVDTTGKKKLAASTTESVKTEEKPRDYLTPDELRNKGWFDFGNK